MKTSFPIDLEHLIVIDSEGPIYISPAEYLANSMVIFFVPIRLERRVKGVPQAINLATWVSVAIISYNQSILTKNWSTVL